MIENIVDKIDLVFENCDAMSFSEDEIKYLKLNNISFDIERITCNAIYKNYYVEDVLIALYKEADKEHYELDIEDYKTSKFKRIEQWPDITDIEIFYKDGHKECYCVEWEDLEEDSQSNSRQKIWKNNSGDLYVVISKKPLEDFIDKEWENDISGIF